MTFAQTKELVKTKPKRKKRKNEKHKYVCVSACCSSQKERGTSNEQCGSASFSRKAPQPQSLYWRWSILGKVIYCMRYGQEHTPC